MPGSLADFHIGIVAHAVLDGDIRPAYVLLASYAGLPGTEGRGPPRVAAMRLRPLCYAGCMAKVGLQPEYGEWQVELVDTQAREARRWVTVHAYNPAAARAKAQSRNPGWIGNVTKPVRR